MKKYILIIFVLVGISTAYAQTPRVSYFMDKYSNRHLRNPAMSPAWGYVNFPGLARVDVGIESNLQASDFLYPAKNGGKPLTFMHEDISAEEFLDNLHKGNHLGFNLEYSPLGFGFYTQNNRFFSFDLSVKANAGFNLPYDFFNLIKNLSSEQDYNMKNLNIAARGYVEAAFGYAQDWDQYLRVGGKLKFLVGVADARLMIEELKLSMAQERWEVNARGTGAALGGFLELGTDSAGIVDFGEVGVAENMDASTFLGGYGGAIDLGATYNLDRFLPIPGGLTVSLGLTDLGFIYYKQDKVQQLETNGTWVYDGIQHLDTVDIGQVGEDLLDELMDIVQPRKVAGGKGFARGLRTTLNAGAEYSFLQDKMSAGLLVSTHFGKPKAFTEITLSYNLRPVKWFALSLSSSMMHRMFGSMGLGLNITPKYGLNLFVGVDYLPFTYGWLTENIPYPVHVSNFNVHFGLSIPLGRNRYHKYLPKPEMEESVPVFVE